MSQELLQNVIDNAPKASVTDLERIVSFGCAILSPESSYPDFPVDSLNNIARIINNNPNIPVHNAIYRLYPYRTFLANDGIQGIQSLLQSLNIALPQDELVNQKIVAIKSSDGLNKCVGRLLITTKFHFFLLYFTNNFLHLNGKLCKDFFLTVR